MLQKFSAATAIALIMATSPAFAQVTPDQVWESLKSQYTDAGYAVTVGSKDETGGDLTLQDISLNADIDGTTVAINIPKTTMRQTGDAKVRSVTEGDIAVLALSDISESEKLEIKGTVSIPGNEVITSSLDGGLLHEFVGERAVFAITDLHSTTSDEGLKRTSADQPLFSITVYDYKGKYTDLPQNGGRDLKYDMESEAVGLDINFAAEDSSPSIKGTEPSHMTAIARMNVDGFSATSYVHIPANMKDMTQRLDLMLNAGYRNQIKAIIGAITGDLSVDMDEHGDSQSVDGTFSSDPGELSVEISKKGLSYQGAAGKSSANFNFSELPFPIAYEIESNHGKLLMPLSKSDEPQPFEYGFGYSGLTLSDEIWKLFDPENVLPRDPANVNIDISGTVSMAIDLLDPDLGKEATDGTTDTATPEMPFEPKTIKIKKFQFQGLGVDADISGDLTTPAPDFIPVGTLEGNFSGLNALLDNLVKMGLVPQDQIMGARLMIGMFAKPVDGDPDNLHTDLEFKEGGSIFANGQQIR